MEEQQYQKVKKLNPDLMEKAIKSQFYTKQVFSDYTVKIYNKSMNFVN